MEKKYCILNGRDTFVLQIILYQKNFRLHWKCTWQLCICLDFCFFCFYSNWTRPESKGSGKNYIFVPQKTKTFHFILKNVGEWDDSKTICNVLKTIYYINSLTFSADTTCFSHLQNTSHFKLRRSFLIKKCSVVAVKNIIADCSLGKLGSFERNVI